MPFKLSKSETFRSQVTIETLDEKGRSHKEVVHCTFRRPNETEVDEWTGKDNKLVLQEFLLNVEGMTDEVDDEATGGKKMVPVPYEGDNIAAFLSHPPAIFAVSAVFWQAARLGRVKN